MKTSIRKLLALAICFAMLLSIAAVGVAEDGAAPLPGAAEETVTEQEGKAADAETVENELPEEEELPKEEEKLPEGEELSEGEELPEGEELSEEEELSKEEELPVEEELPNGEELPEAEELPEEEQLPQDETQGEASEQIEEEDALGDEGVEMLSMQLFSTEGSGWYVEDGILHITGSVGLSDVTDIYDKIVIEEGGTLKSGNCRHNVTNNGTISGGTFTSVTSITNNGTISGGEFEVTGMFTNNGVISDGTFVAIVYNEGEILGGIFDNLPITNRCTISGGTFNNEVANLSTISGGTFAGIWNGVDGTIEGAGDKVPTITGLIRNYGTIKQPCNFGTDAQVNSASTGTTEVKQNINGEEVTCLYGANIWDYASENVAGFGKSWTITVKNADDEDEAVPADASFGLQSKAYTVKDRGWYVEDGILHITGSVGLGDVTDGYVRIVIEEGGTLKSGNCRRNVTNNGTISGGKFTDVETFTNNGTISGGEFKVTQIITNNGVISDGTFEAIVDNEGEILGGIFDNLSITNRCTISGGTFNNEVANLSTISGGTFARIRNAEGGTIEGAGDKQPILNGRIRNYGTIKQPYVRGENATLESNDGTIETLQMINGVQQTKLEGVSILDAEQGLGDGEWFILDATTGEYGTASDEKFSFEGDVYIMVSMPEPEYEIDFASETLLIKLPEGLDERMEEPEIKLTTPIGKQTISELAEAFSLSDLGLEPGDEAQSFEMQVLFEGALDEDIRGSFAGAVAIGEIQARPSLEDASCEGARFEVKGDKLRFDNADEAYEYAIGAENALETGELQILSPGSHALKAGKGRIYQRIAATDNSFASEWVKTDKKYAPEQPKVDAMTLLMRGIAVDGVVTDEHNKHCSYRVSTLDKKDIGLTLVIVAQPEADATAIDALRKLHLSRAEMDQLMKHGYARIRFTLNSLSIEFELEDFIWNDCAIELAPALAEALTQAEKEILGRYRLVSEVMRVRILGAIDKELVDVTSNIQSLEAFFELGEDEGEVQALLLIPEAAEGKRIEGGYSEEAVDDLLCTYYKASLTDSGVIVLVA